MQQIINRIKLISLFLIWPLLSFSQTDDFHYDAIIKEIRTHNFKGANQLISSVKDSSIKNSLLNYSNLVINYGVHKVDLADKINNPLNTVNYNTALNYLNNG